VRKLLVLLVCLFSMSAQAEEADEEYENKQWREAEVQLPAPPRQENLVQFYAGPATDNRFYIDSSTISVGSDGVVRYVLVVLTPEGGRNVTFEGMRCETRERRIYASGRTDGAWSKARSVHWLQIQEVYANRHHAALFLEYFCPEGVIVNDAEDARNALRRGGHPSTKRW
jgi:hypothetical protein